MTATTEYTEVTEFNESSGDETPLSMSNPITTPEQAVRVMQILAGALVMGVVMFAVVAVILIGALNQPPQGMILSVFGAVFASSTFVMHLIVPNLMAAKAAAAAPPDEASLYPVYQTRMIVGLALLEGAAFFNIIATIVEHNWWSLAVAGVLVFWMLAMFPTTTRVKHWVEAQRLNRG